MNNDNPGSKKPSNITWFPNIHSASEAPETDDDLKTKFTNRPLIVLDQQITDLAEEAWNAVVDAGDVEMYQQRGRLVRVAPTLDGSGGGSSINEVTQQGLRQILYKVARWEKPPKAGREHGAPCHSLPRDLVAQLIETPDARVPELVRAVCHPIVVDGRILFKNGYDAVSRYYMSNCPEINLFETVSRDDAVAAAQSILDDIFGEFPFIDQASRAHALAIPLSAMLRPMTGILPPCYITSSVAGAGKGLLIDAATAMLNGRIPCTPPSNMEELRKRVQASLIAGSTVVKIDNLNGAVYSSFLASIFTDEEHEFRELGSHRQVKARNNAIFLINGINLSCGRELARRGIVIRLVPDEETPHLKNSFRLPGTKLVQHVLENRTDILRRLLTMIKYWIQEGCHRSSHSLGSFESWSSIMGAVLDGAGVSGFMANKAEMESVMDTETDVWRALVLEWKERFANKAITVAGVMELASATEVLAELGPLPGTGARSNATKMGQRLRTKLDCVIAGHKITRVTTKLGHHEYRLDPVSA